MTFWQQATIKQASAEPFDSLQLLHVPYILY
jgi:hypothetical protein